MQTPRTRIALVAVAIAAVVAVVLPAQRAAADHTPFPNTVTLVGSLQSELGCPGDWQPECDATQLQPVAGDPGVVRGTITVPAGGFEYKVAINETFDENYGAGGAPGGANIPITAPGGSVTFTYDHATHVISDDLPRSITADRAAHWVRRDLIAWNLPDSREGFHYRLYWDPDGGMTVDDGVISAESWVDIELEPGGLPAAVRQQFPQLADYEALRLPRSLASSILSILTDQVAVAIFNADDELVSATGVQIPGALDDIFSGAKQRDLGPTWQGRQPTLALWAPTAKTVSLLLDKAGSAPERRILMKQDTDGVWTVSGRPSWRNARYLYEVTVYAPSTDKVEVNRVTDPYAVALTTNSQQSVLADLNDRSLRPAGWKRLAKPPLPKPENSTIYELHVRDFSINDSTGPRPAPRDLPRLHRAAATGCGTCVSWRNRA